MYFANYKEVLAPNATTTQAIQGVYLDKSFDVQTNAQTNKDEYFAFGAKLDGIEPMLDTNGNLVVNCPVYAIAVQADGFDVNDADASFDAAYGAQFNPWGGTVTNYRQ